MSKRKIPKNVTYELEDSLLNWYRNHTSDEVIIKIANIYVSAGNLYLYEGILEFGESLTDLEKLIYDWPL